MRSPSFLSSSSSSSSSYSATHTDTYTSSSSTSTTTAAGLSDAPPFASFLWLFLSIAFTLCTLGFAWLVHRLTRLVSVCVCGMCVLLGVCVVGGFDGGGYVCMLVGR